MRFKFCPIKRDCTPLPYVYILLSRPPVAEGRLSAQELRQRDSSGCGGTSPEVCFCLEVQPHVAHLGVQHGLVLLAYDT